MQGIGTGAINLSEITTYLFDLDGVLWRGDTAIEGAVSSIKKLRDAGKRCLFCTNNSSHTTAHYVEKLGDMGLHVNESDVLTSSWVTAHYLSGHFTGPFITYVIGEEGLHLALQKIGARIVSDSNLDITQDVDCVVVGIDHEFSYEKLQHAQRLIENGALFIATNRDGTYPVEDGVVPGAGAIVAAVEAATGVTPVSVGKPRPVMVDLAIERLNLNPEEVAFVGDRLDTDIVCARRAGITAICVLTGVTTRYKAERARGELRPHYIFDTLSALCKEALMSSSRVADEHQEGAAVAEPTTETAESEENAVTIPSEDTETATEASAVPGTPDEASENLSVDDIDQLFAESDGDSDKASSDGKVFDFDTAMTVAQEKEPELPDSQKPATSSQEPEGIDSDPSEISIDTNKAMSTASTEEAKPSTQNSDADAKNKKADAEDFDWKLD